MNSLGKNAKSSRPARSDDIELKFYNDDESTDPIFEGHGSWLSHLIIDDKEIVRGCVAFINNRISKIEEIEIRSKSLEFLDKVFFPKKIISILSFPLTTSGKIDRNKLKEMM